MEEEEEEQQEGEVLKPNLQFDNYKFQFDNLLKHKQVPTMYPIVSCIISYDSTRAILVSKRDDREFWVRMYDLESYQKTFEEMIGGKEDSYIRAKEVEQNSTGKKYAIVFIDDGKFFLRVFTKVARPLEVCEQEDFDINKALGLDNFTMPIQGFPDPFITCSFITDDRIAVQLFYNYSQVHYHFTYDHSKHEIEGRYISEKMDCNRMNFPYKSFFNPEDNVIYCFYRQGQAFTISADDPGNFHVERMTDKDLGQMYLFNNKALIARSSSTVLFFKIIADEDDPEEKSWQQYHVLNIRGFIYFIKGNKRIQITTDDNIYFYLIDLETFEPKLENVMFNFMGCNQMMFGSKVKYGITYKTNQKSFDVYRRRYIHDYKVPISHEILEGSMGLDLPTMKAFLITNIDKIYMYDSETYQRIGEMPITLLKTETREPNQIIALGKSKDEKYIACISGKNLIMKQ